MDKGEGEDTMGETDEGVESKYFPEVNENFAEEVKYKQDGTGKYVGVSLFQPDVGVEKLDGDDSLIYSEVESVGPYSFVDCKQDYDPK